MKPANFSGPVKQEVKKCEQTFEVFIPNMADKFFADIEGAGREVLFAFKTKEDAKWYCSRSLPVMATVTIKYELPINKARARGIV